MEDGRAAWMREALALAERGRLTAPPNPWVGCVLVRDGEVVGRGYHRAPGEAHAEVVALREAGEAAQGATAYVTLEPCDHHGRTPPCTDALIVAGVSRVVAGVEDPDPNARGQGFDRLRAAGIAVEVGVEADAVEESMRAYLRHRAMGRPWCVLKAGASIDGRTAAADGSSEWITGPTARADGHRLRAESQAILVGSGTALTDQPALTVRNAPEAPPAPPLRVVLDARGRVPAEGPLFDLAAAPTLVVTTASAEPGAVSAWKAVGAEVEEVAGGRDGGVDLDGALALLARRGILQVLVEGGPTLHGALLAAELADEFVLYVGGALLGDGGRPLAAGLAVRSIETAPRWRLVDLMQLDGDARLTWRPEPGKRHDGMGA